MSPADRKFSVVPFAVAAALTGMLLAAAAAAEAGTVEPDKIFHPSVRLCVHQVGEIAWGTDLFVHCVKSEIDQRIAGGAQNGRFKRGTDRARVCLDEVAAVGVAASSESYLADRLERCLLDATTG